jgi:hypothetical protein
MENEAASAAARVAACGVLLDRGFGKPLSAVEFRASMASARPPRRFIINRYRDGQLVRSSGVGNGDDDDGVH